MTNDTDSSGSHVELTSAIFGDGYGSAHVWRYLGSNQNPVGIEDKFSRYICRDCEAHFMHRYDLEPDIFKAMEETGVPEECNPGVEA